VDKEWPQRVISSLGRAPNVGDWFAECCILDLMQIETKESLDELLDLYDDIDSGGRFWSTKETALAELGND
jgi:hypothetical protein